MINEEEMRSAIEEEKYQLNLKYLRHALRNEDLWGQIAEECSEMAQAALKIQRTFTKNPPRKSATECVDAFVEEHADVNLCLELLVWNDKKERKQIMREKAERWVNHLESVRREEKSDG